jgi:hypothetical protein
MSHDHSKCEPGLCGLSMMPGNCPVVDDPESEGFAAVLTKHGYIDRVTYEAGDESDDEFWYQDTEKNPIQLVGTVKVQRDPELIRLRQRVSDLELSTFDLRKKLSQLIDRVEEIESKEPETQKLRNGLPIGT